MRAIPTGGEIGLRFAGLGEGRLILDDHSQNLKALGQGRDDPHREFLMSELQRASLCHPANLSEDVVSTNAQVTYRLTGTGRPISHVLANQEDLNWPGAELSVLTPLGSPCWAFG